MNKTHWTIIKSGSVYKYKCLKCQNVFHVTAKIENHKIAFCPNCNACLLNKGPLFAIEQLRPGVSGKPECYLYYSATNDEPYFILNPYIQPWKPFYLDTETFSFVLNNYPFREISSPWIFGKAWRFAGNEN